MWAFSSRLPNPKRTIDAYKVSFGWQWTGGSGRPSTICMDNELDPYCIELLRTGFLRVTEVEIIKKWMSRPRESKLLTTLLFPPLFFCLFITATA